MDSTPPGGSRRAPTSPGNGNGPSDRHTHLRVGDLEIDTRGRRVSCDGEAIELPEPSWLLLQTLIECWPGVATQEELLAEVWPDAVVGEETLTQRVKLLRHSLGDDRRRPRYITTVGGVGYRLAERVMPIEPGEVPAAVMPGPARRRGERAWLLGLWIGGILIVVALLMGALIVKRGLETHAGAPAVEPAAESAGGTGPGGAA